MSTLTDQDIAQFDAKNQDSNNTPKVLTDDDISNFDKQQPPKNPAFLPNENKVLEEQNNRPDSVKNLQNELNTHWNPLEHPIKESLKPAVIALKAASVPFQRAEAGIANVGMEAQKGNTNPWDYLDAAAKGISGQRQGELGDLIRTTGFGGNNNEAIAKTVGLSAALPVYSGVGGVLDKTVEGISKGADLLSGKTMSEYLRPKDKNLLYGKTPETVPADERISALNAPSLLQKMKQRKEEVGAQIGDTRNNNPVQIDITPAVKVIDDQISNLEKNNPREMSGLINRLKDKKSDLLREVNDPQGNVISSDDLTKVNLADAHDFRDRSTSTTTKNVFSQTPNQDDIYNETMRNVYRDVTSKMNDADSSLIPLNRRYGNLKSAVDSLENRMKIANKNTGIMGDALSGGMAALGGHAVGAAAGPVGVAGIVAHRIAQTAAFKTNFSILMHDVSTGAASVHDLADAFLQMPQNIKNQILAQSPSIRNKLGQIFNSHNNSLGMAGKVGSNIPVSRGSAVTPEIVAGRGVRELPSPTEQAAPQTSPKYSSNDPTVDKYGQPLIHDVLPMQGETRKYLPSPQKPIPQYLQDRQNIPKNIIPPKGSTEEQVKRVSRDISRNPSTQRPSTSRRESQIDMSKGGTPTRTALAVAGGATSLGVANANAMSSRPIKDEDAIKAIIGEGESTGFQGMRALASAIRNRGTLHGVYGIKSPRVVNNLYSPKTYRLASQAWMDSNRKDYSNGANHWFSDADLKQPRVKSMVRNMKRLNSYHGNNFFKENGR